jgi:hypothetical protein
MELTNRPGKVEHDLGHVRAALQVAPPLELEKVSLRPQHHVPLETLA